MGFNRGGLMRNIGFIFAILTLAGCAHIPEGAEKKQHSKPLVTMEEINWSLKFEDKVQKEKYEPTPQELAKYQDIVHRFSSCKSKCKIRPYFGLVNPEKN